VATPVQQTNGKLTATGLLSNITTATFAAEKNDGNSGTGINVDWTAAQQHFVTLTGNCAFTFTNPVGPGTFLLRLQQNGTGGFTASWPTGAGGVKWVGSAPPVITPAPNAVDILSFYWNGTNYYATYSQNFG
jgi:hypothetical protein